jgi:glycosyltransferase involved in cell wall biosynthesis
MAVVSIVVPVYHNAGSLPDLLARFQALAERNAADRFEFIFVDDGSRDHSFEVLQALAVRDSRIRVVKLTRNFGSTAAILAGLAQARGEAVAAIAADLQDPPEVIDEMLASWRAGTKVVVATRASRDDPRLAALLSACFYKLFRRFASSTMPEGGFDFFLIDRQICDLINGVREKNTYLMGLILWLGFTPTVLHYHRQRREERYGQSMWTLAKKLKYFADSFVAFSYLPVRLASLLGLSISVIGGLYAVFIIITRLFYGARVEGWASLMVVLLLVSGAQLLVTGILGEYLWRNLEEARGRPQFVIERIVENTVSTEDASSNRAA